MNISVWLKYKIVAWISGFIMIFGFILSSIFFGVLGSFFLFLGLGLVRSIYLHSIKCPKCNLPIDNWTTIFSGNKDGWFETMKKNCCNCGYDLTQKDSENVGTAGDLEKSNVDKNK